MVTHHPDETPWCSGQVQRLAMDGSMKLLNTMSGPIKERLDMGKPVDMLAMAVAGYSRYMMGIDEQGGPIVTQDPQVRHGGGVLDGTEAVSSTRIFVVNCQ